MSAGLANVITFAYLGRVHMSLYTIGCTVSAAATLQIPQLLKMCMDFLLAELNVQTCVYIWNIAAAYGLLPVCDAARRFVLENFVQFAETPLFTQLTLEQIEAFLQDDSLLLPSEVTAFQVRGQNVQRHLAAVRDHRCPTSSPDPKRPPSLVIQPKTFSLTSE